MFIFPAVFFCGKYHGKTNNGDVVLGSIVFCFTKNKNYQIVLVIKIRNGFILKV